MSFFAHEEDEDPKHPSKPIKLFSAAMKEAFGQCCAFRPTSPSVNVEEEFSVNDIEYEQEVIILAIRTRAMEAKMRRKKSISLTTPSFRWPVSLINTGELIINDPNRKLSQLLEEEEDVDDDEKETFYSARSCFSRCRSNAGSCFSRCSSASREVILSSRSCLSLYSSTARVIEFSNIPRRSIMQEFCHFEGWPFGLCRKALLLPPLPTSPTESWLSRRGPLKMFK